MSRTGKLWLLLVVGLEVADLRSQLMEKLGVEAPETTSSTPVESDPLGDDAHMSSEWVHALLPVLRDVQVSLNPNPSYGAVRQAHDVLMKQLKARGDKRTMATLRDLRSRYTKRREKIAWARFKKSLESAGMSAKLYRAVKQSSVEPELALKRWARLKSMGLNGTDLRNALVDG